jgi:hypothetical protein
VLIGIPDAPGHVIGFRELQERATELQLEDGTVLVAALEDLATSFGRTAKCGSSKIDGSGRPRVSEGIVQAAGSGEQSRIGDLLYCLTAAVSHVTWFGLQTVSTSAAPK